MSSESVPRQLGGGAGLTGTTLRNALRWTSGKLPILESEDTYQPMGSFTHSRAKSVMRSDVLFVMHNSRTREDQIMTVAAEPTPYLDAAKEAARWIRSTGERTANGLIWRPDPDRPEKTATISAPQTIYSGNAGIVLFLLELYRATGETEYLDDAVAGADEIVATWRDALTFEFLLPLPNVNLDFNHGLSGTMFVLEQLYQETVDQRYRATALAIVAEIVTAAKPVDGGVAWMGAESAAIGDGNIVLNLLWAAKTFDDPSLIELAKSAGDVILAKAEPDPRGGWRWKGFPLESIGAPEGAFMPNFEFGTAGVAYVMARLYEETGDDRFLEAAREGEANIEALATVTNDSALLFFREPDHTDLFYLGYCGGPVGTARLPFLLHTITGEARYLEWAERFARGVMTSGVPEKQTPGLWNVVCQCCGTAGILDFIVSLWIATGKVEYRDYARRVADQTLSHSTNLDGKGNRWYQAWTRTTPWDVTAETGYMIGAAGVGSAALRLHLAEEGRYSAPLFPDNPFPQQSA
jgi:rhamnogalacturonyl hydrolase YesR